MTTEWLAIQSFRQNQDILSAINTLSIHTKLSLAGVDDQDRIEAVAEARDQLDAFLKTLDQVIDKVEETDGGALVGTDPRLRQLARSFVAAKRDGRDASSPLFRRSPSDVTELLTSADAEEQRALIASLSDLRALVEEHFYSDVSLILGEF